jgi:hypothetical protein
MPFDTPADPARVNYRDHPELYPLNAGDLLAEPYRGELMSLLRFATAAAAVESAEELAFAFTRYKTFGDFVGMDTVRKLIQMGVTRSRRRVVAPGTRLASTTIRKPKPDADAEAAATAFGVRLEAIKSDPEYLRLRDEHARRYGSPKPTVSVVNPAEVSKRFIASRLRRVG